MNSAGIVKIVPDASEELALPIVCARFASSTVPPRAKTRNAATDSTAIGIEVETVSAALSPMYAFAAPKTIPKTSPQATALNVSSAAPLPPCMRAGVYGRSVAGPRSSAAARMNSDRISYVRPQTTRSPSRHAGRTRSSSPRR